MKQQCTDTGYYTDCWKVWNLKQYRQKKFEGDDRNPTEKMQKGMLAVAITEAMALSARRGERVSLAEILEE